MKRILILAIIVVLIAFGVFLFLNSRQDYSPAEDTSEEERTIVQDNKVIEKTASFVIFTNGNLRTFTDPMYHNLSDDVYIEKSNPNIVKIKKAEITWNDFFKTLPFKLGRNCLTTGTGQTFCTGQTGKLKFYVNSLEDGRALDTLIGNRDKLLVSFGNDSEEQIADQLKKIPNP